MEIRSEWLKGYIDLIILSLLMEKDLYGYEMTKEIKQKSQNKFELKEGTLYPALKRLQTKELITGYWSESEGGARRKYYHISTLGADEFQKSRKEWDLLSHIMNLFLEVEDNEKDRTVSK